MLSRFRILPILLVVLCLAATTNAQSQRVFGVISERAPVTLAPEPGRTPLATLEPGTQVQVLGNPKKGWYQISFLDGYLFGERVGFVRVEHLRLQTPPGEDRSRRDGFGETGNGGRAASTTRSRYALSTESIIAAVIEGRQRPGPQGLSLAVSADGSPAGGGNTAGTRPGQFRLQLYTPLAWIRQLSSDASSENRQFDVSDVTEQVTEPVLRINVYSDTSAMPGAGSSWVRHLILRSLSRNLVVQPLTKQPFAEHIVDGSGGRAVAQGLKLTFAMDAVRELRGAAGDIEFSIVVTGPSGQEKSIRITRKQLADLPM